MVIVEDGKVTWDEREELLSAARALGSDDNLPKQVLEEARVR